MKKVKTEAAKVEAELNDVLGEENRIHKNYLLEYRKIEAVQIEGIVDDILLLLFEPNYLRPAFKVETENATIASIFCKITGNVGDLLADFKYWQAQGLSEVYINKGYKGIAKMPHKHAFRTRPKWYSKEKGIDVDLALKSDLAYLNLLSPAYRRNYLEAINNVLLFFKNGEFNFSVPTDREILEILMYNSNRIIKMFHQYDYHKHAPKFVVDESGKKMITPFAIVRLLMMQNLGFDVILLSADGFASVENYLSVDDCPVYRLTEKEKKYSITYQRKQKFLQNLLKFGSLLLAVIIVLMLIRII